MNTIIISIIAGSIIVALSTYIILLRKMLKAIGKTLEQSTVDSLVLLEELDKYRANNNNKSLEQTEGFVKFLSQSRDWAFQYIEDVQASLNTFVETVGPAMAYYDKFGRINESPSMNTIFDAYTELIKVLPETENKEK